MKNTFALMQRNKHVRFEHKYIFRDNTDAMSCTEGSQLRPAVKALAQALGGGGEVGKASEV